MKNPGEPKREDPLPPRAEAFARELSRPAEPSEDGAKDPWGRLASRGLLGAAVSAAYGGQGAGWSELQRAFRGFVECGGPPGLALSWAVHLVLSRAIESLARPDQKDALLPALAAGRATAAMALSEPGAGGNPKRIATKAERSREGYVLDGEKAWITNGPLADRFVVFAATGERDGRREFTAFLVARDAPGLEIREMAPFGFLREARHATLRLARCAVEEASILGRPGRAWEDLSRPFRTAEDVLLAGAILGGLRRQASRWRDRLSAEPDAARLAELGRTACLLDVAEDLAARAAGALDAGEAGADLEDRIAAFHILAGDLQGVLLGEEALSDLGDFGKDVNSLITLGMHATRGRLGRRAKRDLMEREKT